MAYGLYHINQSYLPILRTIGAEAEGDAPDRVWPSEHWGQDSNVRYLLYATTSGIHEILSTPLVYAMHILVLVDPEPCSSL